MSIESRLADVEESLRLLRDANRLQGRRVSAEAPADNAPLRWNATTKKWEAVTLAVLTARKVSVSDSSTRATVLTPTSGKKVRIISCQQNSATGTAFTAETYFGTGAFITTNAGSEIMDSGSDGTNGEHTHEMVWPDGGGPVGAVDEVVSMRTGANVTAGLVVTIVYREE